MHRLRREFGIKDLCRVLRVGRSTYYKHFNGKESPRTVENRTTMGFMLRLYGSHSKRMGVLEFADFNRKALIGFNQ